MFQLTVIVIQIQDSAQELRLERTWPLNSSFGSYTLLRALERCHVVVRELILWALAEAHSLDKQKALFQTITNNILQGLLSIPCSDKLMLYLIVLLIQINEITYGNRYSYGEYNEV